LSVSAAFADPAVAAVFDAFATPVRPTLLALRGLILRAAAQNPRIGPLQETLKWGEPAWLPLRPRTGTTVRINARADGQAAVFVNCRTSLVSQWRDFHGDDLWFEGNRAILLDPAVPLPEAPLRHCFDMALTYHLKG
jgi:hypothetical protein